MDKSPTPIFMDTPKNATIRVRVTPALHGAIRGAVARRGQCLSEWARDALLRAVQEQSENNGQ